MIQQLLRVDIKCGFGACFLVMVEVFSVLISLNRLGDKNLSNDHFVQFCFCL